MGKSRSWWIRAVHHNVYILLQKTLWFSRTKWMQWKLWWRLAIFNQQQSQDSLSHIIISHAILAFPCVGLPCELYSMPGHSRPVARPFLRLCEAHNITELTDFLTVERVFMKTSTMRTRHPWGLTDDMLFTPTYKTADLSFTFPIFHVRQLFSVLAYCTSVFPSCINWEISTHSYPRDIMTWRHL